MKQKCLGFTLVETVMALGIVSGGLLILLGVLSSTIQGAIDRDLRRGANDAANAVLSHLLEHGGRSFANSLLVAKDDLEGLAAWDSRKLFVDRGAEFVGTSDEIRARGYERFDQAHFFEAVLVSDTAQWRGGEANGSETTIVSIGLTWPASQPDGAPTPAQQRSRLTVRTCLPQ